MTNEELIALCKKYYKREQPIEFLEDFLQKKEEYLKNPTRENRLNMRMAFDLVFTDAKSALSCHLFSEQVFWKIVNALKEMPEE